MDHLFENKLTLTRSKKTLIDIFNVGQLSLREEMRFFSHLGKSSTFTRLFLWKQLIVDHHIQDEPASRFRA